MTRRVKTQMGPGLLCQGDLAAFAAFAVLQCGKAMPYRKHPN